MASKNLLEITNLSWKLRKCSILSESSSGKVLRATDRLYSAIVILRAVKQKYIFGNKGDNPMSLFIRCKSLHTRKLVSVRLSQHACKNHT